MASAEERGEVERKERGERKWKEIRDGGRGGEILDVGRVLM